MMSATFYNVSGCDDDTDVYFDDIYIDGTVSRVELGNSGDYSLCDHVEMQVPTTWAATEITVNVNTGSFADQDAAYLFVVDADGNVSNGYPVVINATSGGIVPTPTNFTATRTP
jgi:hypothetical protein